MSDLIDGPKPVRSGEELDLERLSAYLSAHADSIPGAGGSITVEQFPSGFSNLTYLLRVGQDEVVLRRPPFGVQVKSGHDMGREFRVLSGLHPVYPPAPRPLLFCEDEGVIGAPFYLMERRQGVILRNRLPKSLSIAPEQFRRMSEALIDNLADLHAVDFARAGLDDLGKPVGYVRRQVEGWIKRFERAQTSQVADIEAIGQWLVERIPEESGASLVHNDYKFDNVMLDPNDLTRIVAVLDWEMCTLGDPLMDLGCTLGYWAQADDDPAWRKVAFSPTAAPGAPTRRELGDRYAERTGRDVSNMLYYYCFSLLKIAAIVQQIYYRFHEGFTADPRFAQLDEVVVVLGRTAVRAAERGQF